MDERLESLPSPFLFNLRPPVWEAADRRKGVEEGPRRKKQQAVISRATRQAERRKGWSAAGRDGGSCGMQPHCVEDQISEESPLREDNSEWGAGPR